MANTLATPRVRAVLDRLFAAAERQEAAPPPVPPGFSYTSGSARDRCDVAAAEYMPISASGGKLLYALVRASRPETVVEFGTSYGISTIHLAAAVADNGTGHVFATELSVTKIAAARANLQEAGLANRVTILEGDARETLRDVRGPIGLVLLDGWKDLCLPVLRLLESRLTAGALVVVDDTDQAALNDYLAFVRDPANGYVTVPFPVEDGMEISCHC